MIARAFTLGFHPAPKTLERHPLARRKALDEDNAEKMAYRAVDGRDGMKCRCCGRRTTTRPSLDRYHTHHHMQPRSTAAKAEKHSTRNIACVCARCHSLITAGKMRVIGRNCDQSLCFVWSALSTPAERDGLALRDERKS